MSQSEHCKKLRWVGWKSWREIMGLKIRVIF